MALLDLCPHGGTETVLYYQLCSTSTDDHHFVGLAKCKLTTLTSLHRVRQDNVIGNSEE